MLTDVSDIALLFCVHVQDTACTCHLLAGRTEALLVSGAFFLVFLSL